MEDFVVRFPNDLFEEARDAVDVPVGVVERVIVFSFGASTNI